MQQRSIPEGDVIRQLIDIFSLQIDVLAVERPAHRHPVTDLQIRDAFANGGHHTGRAIAGFSGENHTWADIPADIGVADQIGPLRAAADGGDRQFYLHLTDARRGDLR